MEARIKTLVGNTMKKRMQLGSKIKHAGSTMYHADTGVMDGNIWNKERQHRVRKAIGTLRGYSKVGDGRTEKMYEVDDGTSYGRVGIGK